MDKAEIISIREGVGYHDIAEDLRQDIESGKYQVGQTLPKQRELAQRYRVNLGTVRRAIGLLTRQGLVEPIRRRGTVIRERPRASTMTRLASDRYAKDRWKDKGGLGFAADREASGRGWEDSDQIQHVAKVEPDAEVAEAFGLKPGDEVYMRARLITDKDVPTHTLISYYLPEHVEGTSLIDTTPGPAKGGGGFAVLRDQNHEPDRIRETVYARMPTSEERKTLKMPEGEPVMVLERRTYTDDHDIVEFARGVHRASMFAWSYEFKIPEKSEGTG